MNIDFAWLRLRRSVFLLLLLFSVWSSFAQRFMENLDRGLVAVSQGGTKVFISWRILGTDPDNMTFNVYRNGTKVNASALAVSNFTDNNGSLTATYTVRPVLNGVEQAASVPASVWSSQALRLPLQVPAGGTTPDGVAYTYSPNDCSAGDLDGDGVYEIIVKWDPSNSKDNSQSGYTGNVFLDAYRLNGTHLWRIDLGRNIRAGAHYTQFQVYDLDSDGKAEVACKTADGTKDGAGVVIGNASADYRNSSGYILTGPEYLTIFNGLTGKAMATTNYLPARGTVSSWGDGYGNRVDRFLAGVGYFDGQRPSLLMCRGYYTRAVLVAWDWRNGQLTRRWTFDSNDSGNASYRGQGAHSLVIGDVDSDGKDEIIYGAAAIDDNGKGLYSTGLGHGDALHLSDMDPDRPGLEVFMSHEDPGSYKNAGLEFRDARTGQLIWSIPGDGADVGRGLALNMDANRGFEMWGSVGSVYNNKGTQISTTKPSINFGVYWDGDLLREILDRTMIDKWNGNGTTRLLTGAGVSSNNTTKATPNLSADIVGDWREEVIWRTSDNTALLIYTTTIPTTNRLYTLMHDPQYRLAIAWQNTGYNQSPHAGFYIGNDMVAAPKPNIVLIGTQSNQAPTVSIAAPLTNAAYTAPASIGIAATARDADGTISTVAFYNGTTLLATDNAAPFSFSWTNVATGTYSITARATDDKGAVTNSVAVNVIVTAAVNQAPVVSITAPLNNSAYTAPASIGIAAAASDADGTISRVAFYNGTTLLSTDNAAPFSFSWTNVAAGTYSITARATDEKGAVTNSAVVNVIVTAAVNQAPVVSITAPLNNSAYTAPASIGIAAAASDADGTISTVAFYNGTTLLTTDNAAPFSFSWTNVAAGTYSITARATDNAGAVTTSPVISVVVSPASVADISGPACLSTSQVGTYSLSTAVMANSSSISWWYTGSSGSFTYPSAGKATMTAGTNFTAGQVCAGVNYSVAPYWKSYCVSVQNCAARISSDDEVFSETESLLYPNPSSENFTLKTSSKVGRVEIRNVLGELTLVLTNPSYEFEFGKELNPGIYRLSIFYEDGKAEEKAISKVR